MTLASVVNQITPDEHSVLGTIDSIITEGQILSYRLLRQSLAEQLSGDYESVVRSLIEKGFLEEVYAEGFDLGLRRVGS